MRALRTIVYAGLSISFFVIFYARYFRWIGRFNELGRLYDPDGSGQVYTSAGQVWVVPAVLFLLLALRSALKKSKGWI
jgi:hypothetical protein